MYVTYMHVHLPYIQVNTGVRPCASFASPVAHQAMQGDDQRRPVVATAAPRAVAAFRYRVMEGTFGTFRQSPVTFDRFCF